MTIAFLFEEKLFGKKTSVDLPVVLRIKTKLSKFYAFYSLLFHFNNYYHYFVLISSKRISFHLKSVSKSEFFIFKKF